MQEPQAAAPEAEAGSPPVAPEPFSQAPQDAALEAPSAPEAEAPTEQPTDWNALWDHEELKGRRDDMRDGALREGRLQGLQEAVAASDETTAAFEKLTRQVGAVLGRLNKASTDGVLDAGAVSQLLSEHQETFYVLNKALDKEFQAQYGHVGYSELLKEMGEGLEDPSLLADFEKRLPLAARRIDKALTRDLLKWLTAKVGKTEREKGRQEGLREGKAAASAQAQPPAPGAGVLAPAAPAGSGRYTGEQWATLTTAERTKARAEGRQPPGAAPTR